MCLARTGLASGTLSIPLFSGGPIKCNTSPITGHFVNQSTGSNGLSLYTGMKELNPVYLLTYLLTYIRKINKNSYCQRQACSSVRV